jgi:hypothetical protein
LIECVDGVFRGEVERLAGLLTERTEFMKVRIRPRHLSNKIKVLIGERASEQIPGMLV